MSDNQHPSKEPERRDILDWKKDTTHTHTHTHTHSLERGPSWSNEAELRLNTRARWWL